MEESSSIAVSDADAASVIMISAELADLLLEVRFCLSFGPTPKLMMMELCSLEK